MTISTAESCTGGLLAKTLTDTSGASAYFQMGVVTYSNESKVKLLNVKKSTLEKFGAVSKETALEMSAGLKSLSNADICISITGIAGPAGGTPSKPVGLVYVAINDTVHELHLQGNRQEIRQQTINLCLEKIKPFVNGTA